MAKKILDFTVYDEGINTALNECYIRFGRVNAYGFLAILLQEKNPVSSLISTMGGDLKLIISLLVKEEKKIPLVEGSMGKVSGDIFELTQAVKIAQQDNYSDELAFIAISILKNTMFSEKMETVLSQYIQFRIFKQNLIALYNASQAKEDWAKGRVQKLEKYGVSLHTKNESIGLDPVIGREEEIAQIVQILKRKSKNNPMLVGDPGTGKTAIVEGLSIKMDTGDSTIPNIGSTIVELNIGAIQAAATAPGSSYGLIVKEIIALAKEEDVILFIDEAHRIMGPLAEELKPVMARGEVKIILATTEAEYKHLMTDKALARRLQIVRVRHLTDEEIFEVLVSKAGLIYDFNSIIIDRDAIIDVLEMSKRYMPDRHQPDAGIDLLEEASARLSLVSRLTSPGVIRLRTKIQTAKTTLIMLEGKNSGRAKIKINKITGELPILEEELNSCLIAQAVKLELIEELQKLEVQLLEAKDQLQVLTHSGEFLEADELVEVIGGYTVSIEETKGKIIQETLTNGDEGGNVLTSSHIRKLIADKTGIPVSAQGDHTEKYKTLYEDLVSLIHGQDDVLEVISGGLKKAALGLQDPNKPMYSALLMGTTGVGKTLTATSVGELIFGTSGVVHRFDMSEYMEPHSVSKLFGSPPGYVGHHEGGRLTDAVRNNPFSIILFDEIEKAAPNVFDALLQVLDAGRMVDGQGNEVNFKNTIVFMTTNLGSELIADLHKKGSSKDLIENQVQFPLRQNFRPEFLQRLDNILVYNPLSPEAMYDIALNGLNTLMNSLGDKGYIIKWSANVPAIIVAAANIYAGGRQVNRYIADHITAKASDLILTAGIEPDTDDIIYVKSIGSDIVPIHIKEEDLKEVEAEEEVIPEEEEEEEELTGSVED